MATHRLYVTLTPPITFPGGPEGPGGPRGSVGKIQSAIHITNVSMEYTAR